MATIQDFLDEKHLEGIINEYIKTKYSIQFDKVMKELKDTVEYDVIQHISFGPYLSRRNDTHYHYKPILRQRQMQQAINGLDANAPYNNAFPDNNIYGIYCDNVLMVNYGVYPNPQGWAYFRKNRPMHGCDGNIEWNNEERYEDLL